MIVVCYRTDPTQYMDEKLNIVEASSSDGALLPKVVPRFRKTKVRPFPSSRAAEISYTSPVSNVPQLHSSPVFAGSFFDDQLVSSTRR